MCFGGGSKSTDVSSSPSYAATPEGGASAVQLDTVGPAKTAAQGGLADQPTQAEVTGKKQPNYSALKL